LHIGIGTKKEERFLKKNGIVESYQRDNNDEVVDKIESPVWKRLPATKGGYVSMGIILKK
jgi:Ca-activated chloride channel family protein